VVAHELGDGGALGSKAEALRSASDEMARRRGMDGVNKRATGCMAASWQQQPDQWGQRRRTATTWPPRPDDVGQLAGLNRPSETAETD